MSYAERDDLMKANTLLQALIGNREAEIERLLDRAHNAEQTVLGQFKEIERLRTVLRGGCSTLALFNVNNYHPTLVTLQAQLLAGLR